MSKPDFWTDCADAMNLSIEGNRLIAHDVSLGARRLWKWIVRVVDTSVQGLGKHEHLPPV